MVLLLTQVGRLGEEGRQEITRACKTHLTRWRCMYAGVIWLVLTVITTCDSDYTEIFG